MAIDDALGDLPLWRISAGDQRPDRRASDRWRAQRFAVPMVREAQVKRALMLAAFLFAYACAWQRAIEPVLVYGPKGRAITVPRYIAERLTAQGRLEEAETPAAAREAMGLPSVAVGIDPGFDGIDRSVHDGSTWREQQGYPAFDLTTED